MKYIQEEDIERILNCNEIEYSVLVMLEIALQLEYLNKTLQMIESEGLEVKQ